MSQNKDMALFAAVSLVASNSRVPQKVRTQLSAFNMAEWDCRDAFQDRAAKCLLNAHHDTEFIGLMMKMNNKTRSQLGKNMAELDWPPCSCVLFCHHWERVHQGQLEQLLVQVLQWDKNAIREELDKYHVQFDALRVRLMEDTSMGVPEKDLMKHLRNALDQVLDPSFEGTMLDMYEKERSQLLALRTTSRTRSGAGRAPLVGVGQSRPCKRWNKGGKC